MPTTNSTFAVIDVETTGFGKQDRIIEIGVVLLDNQFQVVDEYETLVDPLRDLGATHVHGITPKMISMAPSFEEIASTIAHRIENHILVAHNLSFDQRMISQEYLRLHAMFEPGDGVCTLSLTKQKLPEACRRLGISPPQHHRALADARATASILGALSPQLTASAQPPKPLKLKNVPGALSVRTHRRCADNETLVLDRLLSRVKYDEGDTRLLQYMDLLDWVLDDLEVTVEEHHQLEELVAEFGLTPSEIVRAHEQYFHAMVAVANKDGIISQEEHKTLRFIARALDIDTRRVPSVSEVLVDSQEVPSGSAICFTGSFVDLDGQQLSKSAVEQLAVANGFQVVASVTKSKCDVVVAVDPASSSGKAKKARSYGKPVIASIDFLKQVKSKL
jgi:DNA polymerase-3 subunit epsilon